MGNRVGSSRKKSQFNQFLPNNTLAKCAPQRIFFIRIFDIMNYQKIVLKNIRKIYICFELFSRKGVNVNSI